MLFEGERGKFRNALNQATGDEAKNIYVINGTMRYLDPRTARGFDGTPLASHLFQACMNHPLNEADEYGGVGEVTYDVNENESTVDVNIYTKKGLRGVEIRTEERQTDDTRFYLTAVDTNRRFRDQHRELEALLAAVVGRPIDSYGTPTISLLLETHRRQESTKDLKKIALQLGLATEWHGYNPIKEYNIRNLHALIPIHQSQTRVDLPLNMPPTFFDFLAQIRVRVYREFEHKTYAFPIGYRPDGVPFLGTKYDGEELMLIRLQTAFALLGSSLKWASVKEAWERPVQGRPNPLMKLMKDAGGAIMRNLIHRPGGDLFSPDGDEVEE